MVSKIVLKSFPKFVFRHWKDKNFRDMLRKRIKNIPVEHNYGNPPYVIGDIIITNPPDWETLSFESYDLIYSDKFYNYKCAGLLDNPNFLYDSLGWREGPYEMGEVYINKNDNVIDCGANIGLFSILSKKMGANNVIAYEPSVNAYNIALTNFKLNNVDVDLRQNGLYSSNKELKFMMNDSDASNCLSECGNSVIKCVTLDDDVDIHVDFIKSDIEGAEREMLKGATRILKEDCPKLSLCIYHLPDDKKVMTKIIKKANPDYKFKYTEFKMYGWV